MTRFDNLMDEKNDTARMNFIKENVSKIIYEFVKQEFGEDNTKYIDKQIGITPNCVPVAKNTIVIDVGDVMNNDGFTVGAVVEITAKVKKWNTVENKNGHITYGISLNDYEENE